MASTLSEPLLQAFSEYLAKRMGLDFPPQRWPDMLRGLTQAAPALGCADAAACLRWLMSSQPSRPQVEILASELSVGETYFFREPAVFAALETEILPPLIAARRAAGRSLRLWSAGCCTGEEPYSLAILLSRLLPDLADWQVSILGTDINPAFLAKAKRGVYREWSFRGAPGWLKAACFETPAPGSYALAARYRRLVDFEYLNLAEDVYPSVGNNTNGIDIILCRNVLMYFKATAAAAVARKLHRALVEGGWLIVSPSETNAEIFSQFAPVHFRDAIVYRKAAGVPAERPFCWLEPVGVSPAPAAPVAATASAAVAPLPPAGGELSRPPPAAIPTPYEAALAAYAQGAYECVAALAGEAGHDPRALALLARASANRGRLADARRWCEAAVAADRGDPGLRYLLASVLEEQGLPEPATAALKQALYLDQDFVLAHFALGNLYRRLGQPEPARKHFATARRLLRRQAPDAVLPHAEGLTAGRLGEIIAATEGLA